MSQDSVTAKPGPAAADIRAAFMSLSLHLLLAGTPAAPCTYGGRHVARARVAEVSFGGARRFVSYCAVCSDAVCSALDRWSALYGDGLVVFPGGIR